MTGKIENLVLEHLKAIQSEQSAARDRDGELLRRIAHLETMVARIGRKSLPNAFPPGTSP